MWPKFLAFGFRDLFRANLLKKVLALPPGANAALEKPVFPVEITPEQATDRLIAHSIEVTRSQRLWMEENPSRQITPDMKFPGKLDHSTCLAFSVPLPYS